MQNGKVSDSLFEHGKMATLFMIVGLLCASQMTALFAQRVSGSLKVTTMANSAQVWDLTNDAGQVARVIVQPFTYSGTFSETSGSAGWWCLDTVGGHAFRFNIGGNIVHDSPGDRWDFVNLGGSGSGYSGLGTASGTANGNFPYATYVSGTYSITYNSPLGTNTLTGNWHGTLASAPPSASPSPTLQPTPTPSSSWSPSSTPPTPTPTATWTASDLGSVAYVRGPASFTSNGASVTPQNQIGAGTDIQTGNNAVVQIDYPSQGGVVSLGSNTEAAWIGLEYTGSAPDGYPGFTMIPSKPESSIPWLEETQHFLGWTLAGAGIEFALTGATNPYLLGAEVLIHGGILLVRYGNIHIKDTTIYKQIVQFPQGFLQGSGTEYDLSVTSAKSVVQVISGRVIFLDPATNNSISLDAYQTLTLPNQQGFTQQELNSDTSSFDPSSINQWWAQATATPSGSNDFMGMPLYNFLPFALGIGILVILGVAASASAARKRKARDKLQSGETGHASYSKKASKQKPQTPQAAVSAPIVPHSETQNQPDNEKTAATSSASSNEAFLFCPNCGKQLPISKKFCPYCGFNLSAPVQTTSPQVSGTTVQAPPQPAEAPV
jgi:hypothetical protein